MDDGRGREFSARCKDSLYDTDESSLFDASITYTKLIRERVCALLDVRIGRLTTRKETYSILIDMVTCDPCLNLTEIHCSGYLDDTVMELHCYLMSRSIS